MRKRIKNFKSTVNEYWTQGGEVAKRFILLGQYLPIPNGLMHNRDLHGSVLGSVTQELHVPSGFAAPSPVLSDFLTVLIFGVDLFFAVIPHSHGICKH